MEKEDITAAFETEFQDPGAIKSGEYLEWHILDVARDIVAKDHLGLIEVMREWIALRKEPKTILAVSVARELRLAELIGDLAVLRSDIEQRKAFMPWYVQYVDKALSSINDVKTLNDSAVSIIQLSGKWAPVLLAQPETGMGYYVVSVILQDGRKFDQVVIDSGYITKVRGYKDIPFQESDIRKIIVTHDKWNWRAEL